MKQISRALIMCSLAIGCQITDAKQGDVSGKTHLRSVAPFEAGSAMRESIFNHSATAQQAAGKKSGLQVTVFGGKNTKQDAAGAYYLPYGHKTLTFQGQQTFKKLNTSYEARYTAAHAYTQLPDVDTVITEVNIRKFTLGYDDNTDTSIVRPWHFGITHAATQDIYGGATIGAGISFSPQFKSTISPEFHHSHAGVAAAFRYHFSDEPKSFWFEASTAVEWVRNEMKLNEKIETEKLELNSTNFGSVDIATPDSTIDADAVSYGPLAISVGLAASPAAGAALVTAAGAGLLNVNFEYLGTNSVSTATLMKSEISLVWMNLKQEASATDANPTGTYWPVGQAVTNGGSTSIDNVTEAFTSNTENLAANKKWLYGKINGAMKKTRLADVELKMGYNFVAAENYNSNGYLGIVIPTGNKATGEFVGEAIVGNGYHVGLMAGGTTEIMVNQNDDWTVSYRMDTNARYLLKNTQKRSFDLFDNAWSRYLMVWEKDNWTAAQAKFNSTAVGTETAKYSQIRNYSAGINFFTKDMYVTPGFQARINQSLLLEAERYSVELGWNVFAREAEKVALTKSWTENIAFPEATISPFTTFTSDVDNLNANKLTHNGLLLTKNNKTYRNDALNTTNPAVDTAWNADFEITEKMIDLESAASPQSITHTPYVSVNYMLGDADSDRPGTLGVGASYEFAQNNSSLSQWQLWGKLGFNF